MELLDDQRTPFQYRLRLQKHNSVTRKKNGIYAAICSCARSLAATK